MAIELDLSSLFEDIFKEHKREKYVSGISIQTPENRKANWEKAQTDLFNLSLDLFPIEFNFELPEINWSFNFTFNFLLDLHIQFELGLSEENKAYYGKSRYGESFYDPPEWNPEKFRKLIWDIRYKLTNYKRHDPNFTKETAKKWVEWVYETLVKNGVSEPIAKSVAPLIVYYEGKLSSAGYVGFGLVGYAKVMPIPSPVLLGIAYPQSEFYHRSPEDFYTLVKANTITIKESQVGYATVGYCRVSPSTKKVATLKARSTYRLVDKTIADKLVESVERGRKMFEPQEYYGVKYQPFKISQLKYDSLEKRRWKGGRHQYLQQEVINRVKRILNRRGVVNWFRKPYIDFALELMYREYESRNKKKWKVSLESDDPIIEKYIRQGCDESILREIRNVVLRVRS